MSPLSARLWALQQTCRGIWQAKGLFALALALAGLALTIPVFLGTLFWCFSKPVINVPMQTEITVFAERSAGDVSVAELSRSIAELNAVSSVRVVKRADALAMVNKSLGLKDARRTSNPLPDIVIATIAPNISSDDIATVAAKIQKMKDVDIVAYDDGWAKHLSALLSAVSVVLGVLGSVIFALVFLVIAASVRMTTNAQKEEIKALFIFGATGSFICRPYVWRGCIMLTLAALVSLLITQAGIRLLAEPVANFVRLYGADLALSMPSLQWCALFVAGAGIVGAVIGGIAARDSLRTLRDQS